MTAVLVQKLSAGEEKVAAVDAASLISMFVEAATLGPALMDMQNKTKAFTDILAGATDSSFSAPPMNRYPFQQMPPVLDALFVTFLYAAVA